MQAIISGHKRIFKLESPQTVHKQPALALKTVLLVDDVDVTRLTMKWFLANFNYAVESARSAEEALSLFDSKVHDAVVTDNSMMGMTGTEMAHVLKLRSPSTPIVMYSDSPPVNDPCLDATIQKPAHLILVKEALERLLNEQKPDRCEASV